MPDDEQRTPHALTRFAWMLAGLLAVGIGGLGVVLPGLPTTGFFVLAAWCFSKSSPRLEAWVLGLPGIGQLVIDYRDGLGMPRRAKGLAIAMMIAFGAVGALYFIDHLLLQIVVLAAIAVGTWYVAFMVPTREEVLRRRGRP